MERRESWFAAPSDFSDYEISNMLYYSAILAGMFFITIWPLKCHAAHCSVSLFTPFAPIFSPV